MNSRAWLTPDALPSGVRSCVLQFPDSEEWHALVRGCLLLLSEEQNFEAFGGITPQETADTFRQTLFLFLGEDCMLVPAGVILPFGGTIAPAGYLLCDGSEVSRIIYADLYDVIGNAFGSGNGSTTFNLPGPAGRVLVGVNSADADINHVGATFGTKEHTLTVGQLPVVTVVQNAHTHVQVAHTHVQNAHNHPVQGTSEAAGSSLVSNKLLATPGGNTYKNTTGGLVTLQSDMIVSATPTNQNATPTNQSSTPTNQSFGSGQSHNNMQASLATNYIIKF